MHSKALAHYQETLDGPVMGKKMKEIYDMLDENQWFLTGQKKVVYHTLSK